MQEASHESNCKYSWVGSSQEVRYHLETEFILNVITSLTKDGKLSSATGSILAYDLIEEKGLKRGI